AKHILHASEGWVELRTDNVWLDVEEFERTAVSRTLGGPSSVDTRRLVQAIELYRGDLLQGWYQDWCLEERDRLRQIYLETLDALVAACEDDREWNAGVAYAGRALHADPARECTHRALMRIYCAQGDRASALRQYDRCVEALKTELGIGPDAETKELARAIRAGTRAGCGPMEELPRAELRAEARSRRKP
ncbi:MAG TPA: bacterial transcriptional activator domain-containing protein, partial [Candidatus Polarisedimenticolia bacterium]|nr:bacterial transcriptional activator domain-containing protein [Candidatus Polarisedimenticolia bacterium]